MAGSLSDTMPLDYSNYAPVAYAAPMPAEDKLEQYQRELRRLIATINAMKGLTTEVQLLKELASAAESVFSQPLDT